jgi:hypothetical protein
MRGKEWTRWLVLSTSFAFAYVFHYVGWISGAWVIVVVALATYALLNFCTVFIAVVTGVSDKIQFQNGTTEMEAQSEPAESESAVPTMEAQAESESVKSVESAYDNV